MFQLRHAVIAICLGSVSTAVCAETLNDILERVATRSKAYSTVDCKWKVVSNFTESSGKRVGIDPFGDGRVAELKQRLPATIAWMGSFQSDGSKLRLSYDQPVWTFPEARLRKSAKILVSDGVESRSLDTDDSRTQATWTKAQNPGNVGFNPHLTPLYTQFRAFHYPIASLFPPESIDSKVEAGQWDGHECVVLRRNHPGQNVSGRELPVYTLWLDPKADYSVRRYTSTRGEVITHDIRVELAQQDGLWVPKRWQWFDYHDATGDLLAVHSSEILEISMNKPMADSLFELPLPRATIVSDQRAVPNRKLLIGNDQREFEVTNQQTAKASSLEALLQELEQE